MKYFLDALSSEGIGRSSRKYLLARILKKNPLVINEPVYAGELESAAEKTLENYLLGKLIVPGDNRYLSGDLLRFLVLLVDKKNRSQSTFFSAALSVRFADDSFYAPDIRYQHDSDCTLLRNPHITRNEEAQLHVYPQPEQMRKYYLGHLTDVIMLDCDTLVAQRLGGADYDGDMVKTIADPIINDCVKRNYDYEKHRAIGSNLNIPLLQIPTAEPLIRDADDWRARFETVKSTFSSRVGQISNAALDLSIIAYNENSDSDLRTRCREETETLAILTGLEIDSVKSGVKPELSEYLGSKDVSRSLFLKYKKLTEDAEKRRT